jgi:hypothetical protein
MLAESCLGPLNKWVSLVAPTVDFGILTLYDLNFQTTVNKILYYTTCRSVLILKTKDSLSALYYNIFHLTTTTFFNVIKYTHTSVINVQIHFNIDVAGEITCTMYVYY